MMKEWGNPLFCLCKRLLAAWRLESDTLRIYGRRQLGKDEIMAGKNKASTVEQVWEIAQPIAQGLGLEIWDIRFVKEGADWYLRIFIDKEGGVSIDDCEAMSRAVDGPLDEKDPIPQAYIMEVGSPGIERELTRPEHFEKMLGRSVIVKFIRPREGQKELVADLEGFENNEITLRTLEGDVITVAKKETSSVLLNDFDDEF